MALLASASHVECSSPKPRFTCVPFQHQGRHSCLSPGLQAGVPLVGGGALEPLIEPSLERSSPRLLFTEQAIQNVANLLVG